MADEIIEETSLDDIAASLLVKPGNESDVKEEKKDVRKEEKVEAKTEEVEPDEKEEFGVEVEEDVDPDTSDEEDEDPDNVDIDELEIDVAVDGETKKAKLKDLKAAYAGEGAIEKRLQEVTEVRTKVYKVGETLYNQLQAQNERLEYLDGLLSKVAEPEINWDELRQKDPARYLLEKDRANEAERRRSQVRAEQEKVARQQAELNALAYQDFAESEARKLLKAIPEMADPQKAPVLMNSLAETAVAYGYTVHEFNQVIDHRVMKVLKDAHAYRMMQAEKGKKVEEAQEVKPRPLNKPGNKVSKPLTNERKLQNALRAKAQKTGKVDDVASFLLVKKKA